MSKGPNLARLFWLLTTIAICLAIPVTKRYDEQKDLTEMGGSTALMTSHKGPQYSISDAPITPEPITGSDLNEGGARHLSTEQTAWANSNVPNATEANEGTTLTGRQGVDNWDPCGYMESTLYLFTGVACLFGFAGNIISVIALGRTSSQMSSGLLLSALAICDLLYLILKFMLRPMYTILGRFWQPPGFWDWYIYLTMYGWPSVTVTHTAATWVTVLVTIHRFIAVCFPHHAARLCRLSLARKQLIVVLICATLFSLPLYFDSYVATVPNGRGGTKRIRKYTALGLSWAYQSIYRTALYSTFVYIIPLGALFVMVVKLIRALQEANRRRAKMTTSSPAQDDITKILIAIVVVFLASQIWNPMRRLAEAIEGKQGGCWSAHHMCASIGTTVTAINSSTNFVIYIWFGKRFREAVLDMCHCGARGNPPLTKQPAEVTNVKTKSSLFTEQN